jgi:predicted RNA-binding protein with PUA-like domain
MNQEKQINPLAEIQAKLKAPKGQFNSFGKYHYRSAEDILEAVKKVINPMGFSITLTDDLIFADGRWYIKSVAELTDGIRTFKSIGLAREEETKKGMDGSQITGAASSYARKYALNGLFAIDDTKDSDATNDHGKSQESKPQAKTGMPAPSNFDIQFAGLIKKANEMQDLKQLKELWDSLIADAQANKEIQQLFNHRKSELSIK